MKKCSNCGAQMNDDSLICTECGKPIPQGNVCSHCGASVNEGAVFCQNCGEKINRVLPTSSTESGQQKCPYCGATVNDSSIFCDNCGKKIDEISTNALQQPSTSNDSCYLKISWKGAWAFVNSKIKITVNNNYLGEFSYKEGFECSAPITSKEMVVVAECGSLTTKERVELNPEENYTYNLVHHLLGLKFGYILYDSKGDKIREDKFNWGLFILPILSPLIGIVYAIAFWKKKPAASYAVLYYSLIYLMINLFFAFLSFIL